MATDGSVTIVFTDIENSTVLMETLGEERWLELLEWHHHAMRRQTTLFGGSVVKGQGDGFMLAFPAAGSANACATACAMAIQRALSTGWEGVPVPVRIGMHSSNAKAEAGDFFGRTVVTRGTYRRCCRWGRNHGVAGGASRPGGRPPARW